MTFLWGATSSSYQIEGAVVADGRSPSIWDTFTRLPGKVVDGSTGDNASDHYRRFRRDVGLMADLGLQAYRFSVAWGRIVPEPGTVNPQGLAFYDRLTDELLDRGIEPWPTLYHWDLPQYLEDAGGWPERDTAYRFAEYAAVVHAALADRVSHWTTLNEPWCSAMLGYAAGVHAPGRTEPAAALRAAHHLLLGHGLALQTLGGTAGLTLNLVPVSAATDDPRDLDLARRVDGTLNRMFLEPVLLGNYPEDVLDDLGGLRGVCDFRHIRPGDLQVISKPLGMLGVDYFDPIRITAGEPAAASPWLGAETAHAIEGIRPVAPGCTTDQEGLRGLLNRLGRDYPPIDLYLTGNGAAYADGVVADGRVLDLDRIDYLHRHVKSCAHAVRAGLPLKGYFARSLLDGFEWSLGYTMRYGLIHVDFETGTRTLKDSARWYATRIQDCVANLHDEF